MKKYLIIACCCFGIISIYFFGKSCLHNNIDKNISINEKSIENIEAIQQDNNNIIESNIENTILVKSTLSSNDVNSDHENNYSKNYENPVLEKNVLLAKNNLKYETKSVTNEQVTDQPIFTKIDINNESFSEQFEEESFQTNDVLSNEIVEITPIIKEKNDETPFSKKETPQKNVIEYPISLDTTSEVNKNYLSLNNVNIPTSNDENIEPSSSLKPVNLNNINNEETPILINNFIEDNNSKSIDNLIESEIASNEKCFTESLIKISEKKVSEIIVANNKYTPSELLKKRINIKSGDYINERKLQEHLNFINLNPFRKVELIIDPKDENSCNVDLVCHDRFWFRPYVGFDNTGLKIVDRNRIYAGFNWNTNHLLDSILSYQYIASSNFKKFQSHTGHWIIFLPWKNTLTFYGNYAHIDVDHLIPYIIKNSGFALQTSMRYNICLPIFDLLTHELILGFDYKRTDSNLIFSRFRAIDDTPVNLTQFLLSYKLNWNNSWYNTKILFELYFSPGEWLSNQEDSRYNNLRRFAKNQYFYAKGYFSNLFKIPKDFLLSIMLTSQVSNENLLPSETFSLGGYNTVRGYYEREINTDSGIILNFELRSPSISLLTKRNIKDSLRFLLFFDYGYGTIHETLPFEEKDTSIYGFGPGMRYVINPHFATRLDWGIRGKNIPNLHTPKTLVHFSININY